MSNNNINNNNNNNKLLDIGYVVASFKYPSTKLQKKLNILSLKQNDTVYIISVAESGWLDILVISEKNKDNNIIRGWFPQNYIKSYNDNKIRNLHFNKLMHILSATSNIPSSSSSSASSVSSSSVSNSSSSSSSSSINEEDEIDDDTSPIFNSIPMEKANQLPSWGSISNSIPQNNNNNNNNNTHYNIKNVLIDPIQQSKLYSKQQIEQDYYDGKLLIPMDTNISPRQPLIWQVVLNTKRDRNKRNKLIYYNKDLNIHCHQLPTLIDPFLQKEKLNAIPNMKGHKPFLAKNDLFFHTEKDLVSISDLFESALYSSALLKDVLMSRNKLKAWKIMKSISLAVTYIALTVRQFEPFFLHSMKREIRTLLKSILKYSSLIKLNANIHYTNDSVSGINNLSSQLSDSLQDRIISTTSNFTNTTDRNNSIATTTSNNTLTQPPSYIPYSNNNNNNNNSSNNYRMASISSNYSKNSTLDLSPRRDSTTIFNMDTLQRIDDLMFNHIDSLQNSIQLLYYYIQNCVNLSNNDNDKLILPQILPRFFTDSYGNGSWSNCFMDHILPSGKPHSTDHIPHERLYSKQSTTSLTSTLSDGSTATTTASTSMFSRFINEHTIQDNFENFISPVNSISGAASNTTITTTTNNTTSATTTPKSNPVVARTSVTQTPPSNSSSNASSTQPPLIRSVSSATFSKMSTSSVVSKNRNKYSNRMYPLNRDTLRVMKARKETLYHDMVNYMVTTTNSKPNRQEILKIYTELNDHTVNMYVIENLDLSFFHNLRNVLDNCDPDDETIKLLRHTSTNIMLLLNSYFEVKQGFHDIAIDLTIATQQVTLEDPKVFNSMLPFHCVGSMETYQINDDIYSRDGFQEDKRNCQADKFSISLYSQLTKEDTDVEDSAFVNTHDEFKLSYSRYYDINCAAYLVVEKLLEEKERIINYAARTMQDTLITKLQKDEFKDAKWFESDFAKEDITKPIDLTEVTSNDDYLPWYLQTEFQDSIIIDPTNKSIKSGTKEGLISYLVYGHCDGSLDPNFLDVFLLTFKSIFPSTTDMVSSIVTMYHSVPPEGLTFNEYNEWMEKKLIPIKINVVKIFRDFLTRYWTVTYWEPTLESILVEFGNLAETEKIPGAKELSKGIDFLIRHSKRAILHDPVEALNISNMAISSQKSVKGLRLSNIAAAQFAQQVTLINHEIYCQIKTFECLDKIWGKQKNCDFGGSPNISKFIEHANLLTNYVSYKIVSQTDIKKRVKLITYFISVALYCQRLSNFATLTAIISALYSSPVHRLQKTWSQVSSDSKDILHKLDNLMDSKKNFINYRECLRSTPKMIACVPFFGVYLSDLTFANSGNQDSAGMINFRKRVMIHDIIKDIESFQKRTYITLLAKNNDVKQFILDSLHDIPDLDRQYQLSLEIEPRGSSTSEEKSKSSGNNKFWRRKHGMKLFG